MKKNLFGLIINFNSLEHYLHTNEILINYISKSFDNFFIINSKNLEISFFKSGFFSWDHEFEYPYNIQDLKKKLPNNIELFEPKSLKDFTLY